MVWREVCCLTLYRYWLCVCLSKFAICPGLTLSKLHYRADVFDFIKKQDRKEIPIWSVFWGILRKCTNISQCPMFITYKYVINIGLPILHGMVIIYLLNLYLNQICIISLGLVRRYYFLSIWLFTFWLSVHFFKFIFLYANKDNNGGWPWIALFLLLTRDKFLVSLFLQEQHN